MISTLAFAGCSAPDSADPEVSSTPSTKAATPSDARGPISSNGRLVEHPDAAKLKQKMDEARERHANLKVVEKEPRKKADGPSGAPAPDNSVFSASFGKDGYRGTRTFKDHPILSKVEKTQRVGEQPELRVYLRDGRVFKTDEKALPKFRYHAPGHILTEIGLDPATGKKKAKPAGAPKPAAEKKVGIGQK